MIPQTTVETALNSRCSSGGGHWGVFDESSPPSPEQLALVKRAAEGIPRFTCGRLFVDLEGEWFTLAVEPGAGEGTHVESGMQQQAIYLACAALGLGTCIHNVGVDGRLEGDRHLTARMSVRGRRPPDDGALWTRSRPSGRKAWLSGNLPDPDTAGGTPLFEAVERASTSARGRAAGTREISQLLWAARGRTPHLYRGREWGMTIPTWAGGQNYTSIHLLREDGLYRYVNWDEAVDRPTHRIERIGDATVGAVRPSCRAVLILGANEETKRALWEVGYMLENLILQAVSLGISYRAELLHPGERERWRRIGIGKPVAAFELP